LLERDLKVVSGGTDNHLVLLSLLDNEVSGKDLEDALGKVGVTVNKNTVPREKRSPFVTSGVRFGTPAVTTRGLNEKDLTTLGDIVADTLKYIKDEAKLAEIGKTVSAIAARYPLYPEWNA
jgi:glycine hydroxymethyltransferase